MGFPKIVRQTPVKHGTEVTLTVSTVQIARNYYDTVIFDDSADKRHNGMVLNGHEYEGRTFGPYVIDKSSTRVGTRAEAMEHHREALYAARTETPRASRAFVEQ
ncbi:hypothetical protein [Streptomyces acidicola]|uniref:Uncharacterized protein n=1 Tax=Streptomyces acidicola TaxID=2596892 RepID=A0A5N8WJC1_9ACTN|nr:hypothetical protein [Streptomyces acidicola]MPY47178.1 hypothetical protein [Streptomyces acidicola]MPY47317.1 hypothetical protein [Streptomyces acidicola]